MATNRSKPPVAPRSINVQKFAESRGPEMESLQSLVGNKLNNDFRSRRNCRRRKTGHDDRLGKKNDRKRKRQRVTSRCSLGQVEDQKTVPRRVRRRMELKDNPLDCFSTSLDGTKRLRTKVRHAKHFTMTTLCGFLLPLGLQGRGRGSRASLEWYKHGALVHDASYCTCAELEGLDTKHDGVCPVLLGTICGNVMFHHGASSPPQAIAPVTYMWRPIQQQEILSDVHCDIGGCDDSNCLKDNSCRRLVWIWLHASAFDEGFEALNVAFSKLVIFVQGVSSEPLR